MKVYSDLVWSKPNDGGGEARKVGQILKKKQYFKLSIIFLRK